MRIKLDKKVVDIETDRIIKWYEPFQKKRTFSLILIPISIFLLWLVKENSWIGENIFARGIYVPISRLISMVTSVIPFSLMEASFIGLPFVIITILVMFIVKLIKRIQNKKNIMYFITLCTLNILCICSWMYFSYTILCGANYHRYPFAEIAGLEIEESSKEELYELTRSLSEKASELRKVIASTEGIATEDGNIILGLDNWESVAKTANQAYEKIASSYPELGGKYDSVKKVYFSEFMSRMEITGIFWPFTVEANVNIDVPEYSIPATISHELAHQRGFMREDEANFIAYLVCTQSDDVLFQYSGVMLALSYAGNQLHSQSPELYQKLRETYTAEMNIDLREEYYYWAKYEDTVISAVSTTMNDSYLKANSQEDGVKSYGRMVDLLLAEYKMSLD
ncbi:MAG: DUF3810 domain-containing protein [Anaerocolumna sp.]